MDLDHPHLKALRECCRDEAAFQRLCELLCHMEPPELPTGARTCPPPQGEALSPPAVIAMQRYQAMLDACPDLMFRIDATGRYLDFKGNHQAHAMGRGIVGQTLKDVMPPEVAARCHAVIQTALQTQAVQTCKYSLQTAGEQRHYEARVAVSGVDEV